MTSIIENLSSAEKLYIHGDYQSALKYVDKILKKDSHNTDALIIKGNIFYQKHQITEALQYYLQVLKIDSQNKSALSNAANSYFELKNYEQAYDLAQQVLKLDSQDKTALMVWGNSALELEKYTEGKEAFIRALNKDSFDPWCYNFLSRIYQKTGDDKRALACGWKAVELSHGDKNQHINFGYLLYEISLENFSETLKKYTQDWVEKYGQDCIVQYMGNAILKKEQITKANTEYVREIFDSFAEDFDNILSDLNYQAPRLIESEIKKIYTDSKKPKLQILDAGCGTGLCGEFLKKYKRKKGLYGVDISEKMLEKAMQKKCYDFLLNFDLEEYFEHNSKKFDLIVSADVLTYFGDIEKIIKGFSDSLSLKGRIIFTVSANLENDSNYTLHPSGRFLHHKNYVIKVLEEKGLTIEKISENFLRNEGENEVMGYLISAIKA